jgi:hypothetical protein
MAELETTIRCPHCHRDFGLPLMELIPGSSRACPHCGTSIRFAGQDGSQCSRRSISSAISRAPTSR